MNETPTQDPTALEYVGFWPRVLASLIDTVLMVLLFLPLMPLLGINLFVMGASGPKELLVNYLLPAAIVVAFWIARQATPGKMAIGARIVDAKTGAPLTSGQAIGRYLGYYVSMIPLFLGLFWVAFDPRKQGWHDKLAGTVVVRSKRRGTEAVSFEP